MIINEGKTKLMVINGNFADKQPINVNNISITHCDTYIYIWGHPLHQTDQYPKQ